MCGDVVAHGQRQGGRGWYLHSKPVRGVLSPGGGGGGVEWFLNCPRRERPEDAVFDVVIILI